MLGNVNIGEPWGFSLLRIGDLRDSKEISGNSLVRLVVNNAPANAEESDSHFDGQDVATYDLEVNFKV